MIIGSLIIILVYITYFIALSGGASVNTLMNEGATKAFINMFGRVGGTILNAFIVISCLGTLNGLMLATTRGLYSLAVRNEGPKPEVLSQVDNATNMPTNSAIVALLLCAFWLFHFYGANLTSSPIFSYFNFDSSELPIVTTYVIYIPIFIMFIKKEGKSNKIKNIILPIFACVCSLFMIFAAIYSHGIVPFLEGKENGVFNFPILFYLILFLIVMIIGWIFDYISKKRK